MIRSLLTDILARDRKRKQRRMSEETNEERETRLTCDREGKRRKVIEESDEKQRDTFSR